MNLMAGTRAISRLRSGTARLGSMLDLGGQGLVSQGLVQGVKGSISTMNRHGLMCGKAMV